MRAWRMRRKLSVGKLGKSILFDPSYVAKVERGVQAASAALVRAYDQAVGAEGSLIRLHESITSRASLPVALTHVARSGPHVANEALALAHDTGLPASSDEGISIPVRDDDGRTLLVPISRRSLIAALGATATFAALTDSTSASVAARPSSLHAAGEDPIQLLRASRKVLVDNDNLFGPRQIIPVARRHITAIKELRADSRDADRKALLQMQGQFAELCAWFYQDLGNFHEAKFWLHEALEAAQLAGDQELSAYVLARRSQLAGDMRDPVEVVDLAEAAESVAAPRSRLAAVAATYAAHGHALRRDPDATHRAYDHARTLQADVDPDPDSQWAVWLDSAYIEAQRAYSLATLDDNRGAATVFRRAIADLPPGYHRDRGVYLAREAVALAHSGEPEQAATVGLQALAIGSETGSARIGRELARLDHDLSRWGQAPVVIDFKQAVNEAVLASATASQVA